MREHDGLYGVFTVLPEIFQPCNTKGRQNRNKESQNAEQLLLTATFMPAPSGVGCTTTTTTLMKTKKRRKQNSTQQSYQSTRKKTHTHNKHTQHNHMLAHNRCRSTYIEPIKKRSKKKQRQKKSAL